jgi:hypothetical protein
MTKRLEELFDLPNSATSDLTMPILDEAELITTEALSNLEKIENALPQVRGLESSDNELDELSELAIDSFKNLQDLGMQVEARFSAELFNAAGTMLGHAITAKTAKINKKLKMIELQLKKALLDQKESQKEKEIEATPLGEGRSLDRNELLKLASNLKNNDK